MPPEMLNYQDSQILPSSRAPRLSKNVSTAVFILLPALVNDKFLSKKELTERIREMFKGEIPDNWKLTVSAVNFDRKDIDGITVDWIKRRMERLGLKSKHLSNYTGIDKCTVSSLLSGDKELTKWHKVALYYFFKYYEVANF